MVLSLSRRKLLLVAIVLWAGIKGGLTLLFAWSTPLSLHQREMSEILFGDRGELIAIEVASDGRYRAPISLHEIPQSCIDATLTYEDKRFYSHRGIDGYAVVRVAVHGAGRFLQRIFTSSSMRLATSGASTLSMQLARLRSDLSTTSVEGKLIQMWRALVLEHHYSKKQILEAYFTFAPYGGGIEGIAAASAVYFRKNPAHLSRTECAALAVLPQSPTRRFGFESEGFTRSYRRLGKELSFSEVEFLTPLPLRSEMRPLHLARHVADKSAPGIHKLSLDRALQKSVEGFLFDYVTTQSSLGLKNGAVVVVDGESGAIKAYVGSKDYSDATIEGFVDGVTALRSPGSLLKPFVYAKAIDEGIIIPDSILEDIPIKLTSYEPENFEKNFLGLLTARDALVRSRNVPVIVLHNKLGDEGLYTLLTRAGVDLRRPASFYGAAVVLGGIEISLLDVVRLYTSFVHEGVAKSLTWASPTTTSMTDHTLFSAESAFLTREMLESNPAPHGFFLKNIPWKTGTSSGGRDAWAVGIRGKYVAGVWLGNFNGTANANFIGRDLAGPLLFKILATINETEAKPPSHRLALSSYQICPQSGMVATKHCAHKKWATLIPGVSPIQECDVHRGDSETHYSSEVNVHLASIGIHRLRMKSLRKSPITHPPRIISPEAGVEYCLTKTHGQEIPLQVSLDGEAESVFWYADGTLLGSAKAGEIFYWTPTVGTYIIRAVDSLGLGDAVKVTISVQSHGD
jgi:penicillin-binding protein 1C